MDGWMDGWTDGWMDGQVDAWVGGWVGGWIGGWVNRWVDGWMDELAKAEAELKHLEGFLTGVMKKLSNERFVNNAPAAVVELERKKQSDAESKIATLKETIASLKK